MNADRVIETTRHRWPQPGAGTSKRWRDAWRSIASCIALLASIAGAPAHASAPMGIDERIACQTTIEEVRWSHTLWPEANDEPKPPLSDVLSQEQIRSSVNDMLRMTVALEALYGIRIDSAMLQAEIDRMSVATRAPDQLRELYAALDDDPQRIAECLVRPELTQRTLRNAYVRDARQHGALGAQARRDIAKAGATGATPPGVVETTVSYVKEIDSRGALAATVPVKDATELPIELSASEWDALAERLGLDKQGESSGSPMRSDDNHPQSPVRETEDGYVRETVLARTASSVTVQAWSWPKRSFDAWWVAEAARWPANAPPGPDASLSLTAISANGGSPFAKAGDDDTWRTEGSDPAPTGRSGHTAIWTGVEMIVWGGRSDVFLRTGGRYDPALDTWKSTSLTKAPTARRGHTAVWTGTTMVVWGGADDNGFLETGGRYLPASDTWSATSTPTAPTGRHLHTAVWTGNEMIIWGGYNGLQFADGLTNTGSRYNPQTDSWTPVKSLNGPTVRARHSAVWTGKEMIIWGGNGFIDAFLKNGGRYNPQTDSWKPTASLDAPSARTQHTAVWMGSHMVVWGGNDASNEIYLRSGARYDPALDKWITTTTTGAPSRRTRHTAVRAGSEMLVWGGVGTNDNIGGRYDPNANTWEAMSTINAPSKRADHSAVWTGTEMLVWGGGDDLNSGGRYKPSSNSWVKTSTAPLSPSARFGHTAVWTGNLMVIWGGFDGVSRLQTGGRYRPDTGTWTPTTTTGAPEKRTRHSAVWTGSQMIVWGGVDLDTGSRYNPVANTWSATSTAAAPSPRYDHKAIWTGTMMIVWGGVGDVLLNSGGMYIPGANAWAATPLNGAPAAREKYTMVWTGDEMIVWGGRNGGNALATGARFRPANNAWTATSPIQAPSARFSHTAIWTGKEMIVWGGKNADPVNTGARYQPGNNVWIATSTLAAPAARSGHTAVLGGSKMIVWGGYGDDELNTGARYNLSSHTWGKTSLQGAPIARSEHTAIWTGKEMIVWGGYNQGYLNQLGAYSSQFILIAVPLQMFSDGFEDP